MERKEFLMTSGTLITAAMLSGFSCVPSHAPEQLTEGAKVRRPDPAVFKEPILKALTLGLNAPNPHNTQAWKFKILNDKQALFFVDEKKILPSTDPPARQIHIGCGSFVAVFRLGASSLGYRALIEYLPEGDYGYNDIGKKPVARLSLELSSGETDSLFKHIYARQTNRTLYHGPLVTVPEFESITRLTGPTHATVNMIHNEESLPPLLELLYKGMEVECYDWNAYDESRQWFRVKEDISSKKDGINLRVNGVNGIKRWVAETMLSDYSKKAWHNEGSIQSYLKTHYDSVMSSKGVVTFMTATNQPMDWFRCGEDYARFQLAACDQGFCIQPLSQVLQEFPSMKKLYDEFNRILKIAEPAKVQMVVRIGRGKPTEYAYRRAITDVII